MPMWRPSWGIGCFYDLYFLPLFPTRSVRGWWEHWFWISCLSSYPSSSFTSWDNHGHELQPPCKIILVLQKFCKDRMSYIQNAYSSTQNQWFYVKVYYSHYYSLPRKGLKEVNFLNLACLFRTFSWLTVWLCIEVWNENYLFNLRFESISVVVLWQFCLKYDTIPFPLLIFIFSLLSFFCLSRI
jgi:hypothetical protein